uniref:Putative methyltransferase n=1 Tax=viral metagenome TaxID=1070528 RepID=A0A6M3LFT1_9ZZZZ
MGYYLAGFRVVGIDIHPQPRYPFEFHQADAMTYPLAGFDVIHASPPCQRYSSMQHIHKNKHKHPDLIDKTRKRLTNNSKPFIIENVVGAPLRPDLLLCGTMFNLRIAKHRIFESNVSIFNLLPPCNHIDLYDPYHGGEMARGEREKLSKVIGIDWFTTRPEVREAIPPAYTEFIGKQIIKAIKTSA